MRRISLPWSTVFAFTNPGTKFVPGTPWIPANEVKRLRATFELIAAQSNLSITFAYQTCNVENAPDAAVSVGSAQTADGLNFGSLTDVSSNTNAKQLVRFGFLTTNTSAGALVVGRAGGSVEYTDC